MTEKKSRNGQTDTTLAMGEILQTLGEAILAGKDLTIEHWQALYLACKRGATVCRRRSNCAKRQFAPTRRRTEDMAKTRTLTAEVDGKVYTKKTPREYRYFWICDAIHTSGRLQRKAACGWSYKPVNKDGKHPSLGASWFFINTRCVPIASDQGETPVEKED